MHSGEWNYHVCTEALDRCYAGSWSYGTICVQCNCCGRFSKDRGEIIAARIRYHKSRLAECRGFSSWAKEPWLKALQRRNNRMNIKLHKRAIKILGRLKAGEEE